MCPATVQFTLQGLHGGGSHFALHACEGAWRQRTAGCEASSDLRWPVLTNNIRPALVLFVCSQLDAAVSQGQAGISSQLPLLQQLSVLLAREVLNLDEGQDALSQPHIKVRSSGCYFK